MLASTVDHPPAMSSPLGRGLCDATDARRVASGTLRPAPAKVEYRAPSWLAYRLVRLRTEDAEPGKCDISAVTIRAYEGIRRDLQNRPEAIASLGASSCARLSAADARLDHPRLARRTTPRAAHVGADADRAVGAGVPAPSPRASPARFVPAAPVARRPRRPLPRAVVGGGDRLDASSSASSTAPSSASTASSPRPPPPKGAGSAAAALQDATTPDELLAAATLLVLPGEETAHWQAQLVHRKRRRVAASRALARLARWLAPAACLVPDGPRDATARDPRFHRLVRAAAAPLVEPHEPSHDADTGGTDAKTIDDADAADAIRALGSLAPLPSHLDAACGAILARAIDHAGPGPIPSRVAVPAAWAARRLRLASSADANASRVADASLAAVVGLRLRSSPDSPTEPKTETRTWRTSSTTTMPMPRAARTNARWLPGEHIDARVTRRRRRVGRTRRSFWNPRRV